MKKFEPCQFISYEDYTCPSTLTPEELIAGHESLMECPINGSYWRELDGELNHRCEEGEMTWPY